MRASLLALAVATVLGTVAPASIASAQGVAIEGPGVGVRVGEPRYREREWGDRERFGEHRIYRDRVTVGGEGCRSVTVRKRLPDGSVVVRRRSSC
jgi:hypothetical protein